MKRTLIFMVAFVALALNSFGQAAHNFPDEHLRPYMPHERNAAEPFANKHAAVHARRQPSQNATQPLSNNAIKQRLDSLLSTDGKSKASFTYNAAGKATLWFDYSKNTANNSWRNKSKSEHTYSAEGYNTGWTNSRWDTISNIWKNDSGESYTYDASGKIIQINRYYWNMSSNNLSSIERYDYTYNASGKPLQIICNEWDSFFNAWSLNSKYDFLYDTSALGSSIQQISYGWLGGTWETRYKYEEIYNTDNDLIEDAGYFWFSNNWVERAKTEYEYISNANGSTIQYVQYFWNSDSNIWVYSSNHDRLFDANGNLIQLLSYKQADSINTLKGYYKTDNTFDYNYVAADLISIYNDFNGSAEFMKNKITATTEYSWNSTTNDWEQGSTYIYYYSPQEVTSVREKQNTAAASLYPNPATEFFNVALLDNVGKASIELYDTQGRKVLAQAIEGNAKVAVNELKAGLYFYSISTANGQKQSGKLVKQ